MEQLSASAPPTADAPRPTAVVVSVVLTVLTASATGGLTALLAVVWLLIGWPLVQVFEGDLLWTFLGAVGLVLALCAAAVASAVFAWQGSSGARWTLLGLAPVAALGGLASGYYIAPLAVTASSAAVFVLLLTRDSRAWFRQQRARATSPREAAAEGPPVTLG